MSTRRSLLIGSACLLGGGFAYGLAPRRRVTLLARGRTIAESVPRSFGGWVSRDVSDLVAPKIEGSLISQLYGESVGRIYSSRQIGPEIMMLMAHGDTQSDDLQLHRPEICYPAFGYAISLNERRDVALGAGVSVPCRRLIADAPDRRETIVYWARIGEFLPLDRKEQQIDRMRLAMRGVVADGLLARFSVIGSDTEAATVALVGFIAALVGAVAPAARPVLIGSERATALLR